MTVCLGGEAARGIILGLVAGLMFGIVRWALWVTILLMVGGGLLRTSGTQTSWAESWDLPIPLGYCLFSPLCLLLAGCFRRPRFLDFGGGSSWNPAGPRL